MKIEKGLSIFCKVDYTGYADRQQRGSCLIPFTWKG